MSDTDERPDRGGHIIPGVSLGMPNGGLEWQDVQPGWGQDPGIRRVQWGGVHKPFEVRIADAPVIVERYDHPNRPRPRNHGGHS